MQEDNKQLDPKLPKSHFYQVRLTLIALAVNQTITTLLEPSSHVGGSLHPQRIIAQSSHNILKF